MEILLTRGTFELPWASRQALLEQIGDLESIRSLRDAFERVGTLRPVTLSREEKVDLVEFIQDWAASLVGGYADLPEGLYELRRALVGDLDKTGEEDDP